MKQEAQKQILQQTDKSGWPAFQLIQMNAQA